MDKYGYRTIKKYIHNKKVYAHALSILTTEGETATIPFDKTAEERIRSLLHTGIVASTFQETLELESPDYSTNSPDDFADTDFTDNPSDYSSNSPEDSSE